VEKNECIAMDDVSEEWFDKECIGTLIMAFIKSILFGSWARVTPPLADKGTTTKSKNT
jgi:hypothetical protein